MQCVSCTNSKQLKPRTIVHKYKECGLDNVILDGVKVYECPECGEKFLDFGNIEQLHKLIADMLLQKQGRLIGKEIRFLRKRIGLSGGHFAKLLGVTPETVSRYENDASEPSEMFDRLVRFAVHDKEPDRDYDLHDLLLNEKVILFESMRLKKTPSGWKLKKDIKTA